MNCLSRPDSRRSLALLCLGTLLLFAAVPRRAAGQNLLTNGDFSDIGTVTLNNGFAAVGSGGLIPGWTTVVGSANNANVYVAQANSGAGWIPNPESGPYSIQLDSTSNDALGTSSSIAQTVRLTAGQSYLLSFWFTTEVKANLASIIQVTVVGSRLNSTNSYTTTAAANITQANAVWVHVTQTITAVRNGNVTFTFADISTSDSNASVDNISLTLVPEPATCVAGALVLGYFGLCARKRSRARAVGSSA
jgi:hypothetical protein